MSHLRRYTRDLVLEKLQPDGTRNFSICDPHQLLLPAYRKLLRRTYALTHPLGIQSLLPHFMFSVSDLQDSCEIPAFTHVVIAHRNWYCPAWKATLVSFILYPVVIRAWCIPPRSLPPYRDHLHHPRSGLLRS